MKTKPKRNLFANEANRSTIRFFLKEAEDCIKLDIWPTGLLLAIESSKYLLQQEKTDLIDEIRQIWWNKVTLTN